MSAFAGERIAKVMARAGVCSRRDAERLIAEGRVTMNGKPLTSAAVNVTAKDTIVVDGKPLPRAEETRLWRYHKPAGLVVSARDPQGRLTVFDKLREQLPRVVSIGRLDINTEGLLLLTNDGALARFLELPASGWIRRYRVRAYGRPLPEALEKLSGGAVIDGVRYGPVEASIERVQGGNCWLTIAIREGKNREVKRICEHLGLQVNRLIRTSFGPFQLGELPRGGIEEVPPKVLKASIGPKFFEAGNADRRGKIQRP
ncbi:MAG: pseudouridine synthase [Aestuariivirga sp.]|uniref:pseudouridine synthase n=1 Tax=Aestuariivirga sp. TaxID=2650926 RepID=UPI0038D18FC5